MRKGDGMGDGDRVWRERGLREAVLSGDVRAWQTWYDESFAALDGYVAWRCGGLRDVADEVVQETWLVAVRRVRHFDPLRASFTSWLRGIAANLLRNRLRRRQASRALVPLSNDLAGPSDPGAQRDLGERIASALASLPQHYERALRAKYVDRMSTAEMAAENGTTPKAVESLLSRAKAAFREAFGPMSDNHEL
jgi:RNA polymerase sigma-70 factor (ECF subfamily)